MRCPPPHSGSATLRRILGGLLATVAVLGGCVAPTHTAPTQLARLHVTGPTAIDAQTFAGDVQITVDPRVPRASVYVTIESRHPWTRRSAARLAHDTVQWSAKLLPGDLGEVLEVRTWCDGPDADLLKANLRIVAPSVENVRIKTRYGDVQCRRAAGTLDIDVQHGDVLVRTDQPMRSRVEISNADGDIAYIVGPESTGIVDAMAIGGSVTWKILTVPTRYLGEIDGDRLHAAFGDAHNTILLRTVDGDIAIQAIARPIPDADPLPD